MRSGRPGRELKEDSYADDRFDEEENRAMTPDVGSVSKVAKKEGVLEVVELDDGSEKALSSGSAFSEISVKD